MKRKIIFPILILLIFLIIFIPLFGVKSEISSLVEADYTGKNQGEIETWLIEKGYDYSNQDYDEGRDKNIFGYMLEVNAFSWQTSNDCVLSISFYKNNHKNLSEHKRSIIYSILTVLYGKPNIKKYENISNQINFKKAVVVFDKNIYEWKLKDRFLYLQELSNGVYQLRISRGEFYQEPDTPLIKPDDDDTLYDDKITIEFSLQDQDGRNFCLYHNIRSIKDWTSNDNKRYTELLRKQEKNDLEIIWSYRNGRIIFMETQDPQYSTKRGIKVGDSVLKVRDLYSDNSQILVYDKELNEYVEKFCAEDNIFLMIESDQGISINARNPVEKVMMSTEFHTTDGIIDKIMISCLE